MNLLLSFHPALIRKLPSLLLDRLSRTLSRTGPTTGITLFCGEDNIGGLLDWEVLSSPDGPPQPISQLGSNPDNTGNTVALCICVCLCVCMCVCVCVCVLIMIVQFNDMTGLTVNGLFQHYFPYCFRKLKDELSVLKASNTQLTKTTKELQWRNETLQRELETTTSALDGIMSVSLELTNKVKEVKEQQTNDVSCN